MRSGLPEGRVKRLRVVHKLPGLPAEVVVIDDTLEDLQKLVGGYIGVVRVTPDVHAYVDDEGLFKELPLNFNLNGNVIVGPAVFSKIDRAGAEIGFEDDEDALDFCCSLNLL